MKHKILLASDTTDFGFGLLRYLIISEGFEVLLAQNIQEVVQKTDAGEISGFDLLLINLDSRTDEGWRALDAITEANPFLPVILIVGIAGLRVKAEAVGALALVEKPVDVSALLQTIRKLLAEPLAIRRHGASAGHTGFQHVLPKEGTFASNQHGEVCSYRCPVDGDFAAESRAVQS